MQGLAKTAPEEGHLELVTVAEPEPGPGEVLVEVAYAGICGSDLGIYHFEEAYEPIMDLPRIIGHEYAGHVTAVGEAVEDYAPGDLVVGRPARSCGRCEQCRTGSRNVCRNRTITGVEHDGAFAERVVVAAETLNPVPEGLPPEVAVLSEPASVGVRAASVNAEIQAGDRVLVEGPGPIGLLTAQIAALEGGTVTVSGIDRDAETRLPFAEGLGLDTVNVQRTSIEAATESRTDGGFDVVIDATGAEAGLVAAGAAVKRGGQVVLVGQTGVATADLTPFIRGEIDLQFSYGSTWADAERALTHLDNGAIAVEGFVDTSFSIRESEAAFRSFGAGECCKPLFDLSELREG